MKTAEQILDDALGRARIMRSDAYKQGILASLRYRTLGETTRNPFVLGSPEADAWFSGEKEGDAIWRKKVATECARRASDAPAWPGR